MCGHSSSRACNDVRRASFMACPHGYTKPYYNSRASDRGCDGRLWRRAGQAGAGDQPVVADRGYCDSQEILACETVGITVTLPKPMTPLPKITKQPDAAEVEVVPEDGADPLGLFVFDDELLVPAHIAKRYHPADPQPLRLEAPILSWIRSPVTSRSNWAKDSSTLRVSRPWTDFDKLDLPAENFDAITHSSRSVTPRICKHKRHGVTIRRVCG
jgi:hypothetical protein